MTVFALMRNLWLLACEFNLFRSRSSLSKTFPVRKTATFFQFQFYWNPKQEICCSRDAGKAFLCVSFAKFPIINWCNNAYSRSSHMEDARDTKNLDCKQPKKTGHCNNKTILRLAQRQFSKNMLQLFYREMAAWCFLGRSVWSEFCISLLKPS